MSMTYCDSSAKKKQQRTSLRCFQPCCCEIVNSMRYRNQISAQHSSQIPLANTKKYNFGKKEKKKQELKFITPVLMFITHEFVQSQF